MCIGWRCDAPQMPTPYQSMKNIFCDYVPRCLRLRGEICFHRPLCIVCVLCTLSVVCEVCVASVACMHVCGVRS